MHTTYLMRRRDKGFRIGTSRTYTNDQVKPVVGFMQRSRAEHADAAWVVSTHDTEGEARATETTLALKYGVPTLPFVARAGSDNGLVAKQALIDRVFAEVEEEGGIGCLPTLDCDRTSLITCRRALRDVEGTWW